MTVSKWSGHESRILRQALRLSVREFAEDLGISPRTVSKWEAAGAALSPRPEMQRALDTSYRRASSEERKRFNDSLGRARNDVDGKTRGDPGVTLTDSAAETAAFAVWWEATSTGPVDAEIRFTELRRLAGDYLNGSPEPVVRALRDLRNCVFLLLRGHQSPGRARDLHLAAGYTCVLLAWLSGDLSHHGAADTHARAGALFAEQKAEMAGRFSRSAIASPMRIH